MPSSPFIRARAPDQIEARRASLLKAARGLVAEGGLEGVTLSAIARQANLAKSNVYRYFESREEILLHVLVEEELLWVGEVERRLAPLAGRDDTSSVARVLAETFAAQPTMCLLISGVAGVLEHNVTADTVIGFKTRVLELSLRLKNALHTALPSLPHARAEALLRYMHALVAGTWPMAHPAEETRHAMTRPGFEPLCSDFATDMQGALSALLSGLLHGG